MSPSIQTLVAEVGKNLALETRLVGATPIPVGDVEHDSRQVSPGCLFAAFGGAVTDGHAYAEAAVAAGATALLVERWLPIEVPQIRTDNVRRALGPFSAAAHSHPSKKLTLFGITGTNGKTTTTSLFADVVKSAGRRVETIGTLSGTRTTPEATELQRRLAAMVADGADTVAIEVSSHALDQARVDATAFSVAAFTNLTPDHLNYHGNIDAYFEAKARLFDGRALHELINVDDPWGQRLADRRPAAHRVTLAEVSVLNATVTDTEVTWRGQQMTVPLPGRMNVANAVMAAEAALSIGLTESQAADGVTASAPVAGRMQIVPGSGGNAPTVFVDYSHTPDAIQRALSSIAATNPGGKRIIIFGCGGDRDRSKRPMMARAAEEGADIVIITSDNPRSEDPDAIIAEAASGLEQRANVELITERQAAIAAGLALAGPGDVVLIAGKGHERTQTIGTDVFDFDDVTVASELLAERST